MSKAELAKSAACEQRFLSKERSADELRLLYLDEFGEYLESKELVMLGDEPLHMLAEAGDLGVLYSQLESKGQVSRDIQIIHDSVLEDLEDTGVDMVDCTNMKNARNAQKYPSGILTMNGFDQDEYKELCREFWSLMGGDDAFYYAYMIMADKLMDEGEIQAIS